MNKIGSKRHISTTVKATAGVIEFHGYYFSGKVWSNDGTNPTTYKSQKVAEKMAERHGLTAVRGISGPWYLESKEA